METFAIEYMPPVTTYLFGRGDPKEPTREYDPGRDSHGADHSDKRTDATGRERGWESYNPRTDGFGESTRDRGNVSRGGYYSNDDQ